MLHLRIRVDMGVMAMKFALHLRKHQHYWRLALRLFNVIPRSLVVRVLTLGRESVGVFYSPSKLGYPIFKNSQDGENAITSFPIFLSLLSILLFLSSLYDIFLFLFSSLSAGLRIGIIAEVLGIPPPKGLSLVRHYFWGGMPNTSAIIHILSPPIVLPIVCCLFPGLWSALFGGAEGAKVIFGFCRMHVDCGPATGPTLKKVLCRTCQVVGRRTNKVLSKTLNCLWRWDFSSEDL